MTGVDDDGHDMDMVDQLQNEQYGLYAFQKKDKFEKFYVRSEQDYVFQIENLPEAFAKLEEEESQI